MGRTLEKRSTKTSRRATRKQANSSCYIIVFVMFCLTCFLINTANMRQMQQMQDLFSTTTAIATATLDDNTSNKEAANDPSPATPPPVNCSTVDPIEPVNIKQMRGNPAPYHVSYAWWDIRLKRVQANPGRTVLQANPAVIKIQELIQKTSSDRVFIDVGANVGFMSNYAMSVNRFVYAVEPIQYNIAKMCEAWRIFQPEQKQKLVLFHAAAGTEFKKEVTIHRPSDKTGYFDRTSMIRANLGNAEVVEEHIPLLRVDEIIPEEHFKKVGVVKIDVQGFEYSVLQGMSKLFELPKDEQPQYVFYELTGEMSKTGGKAEDPSRDLLQQTYGYVCEFLQKDMLCSSSAVAAQ